MSLLKPAALLLMLFVSAAVQAETALEQVISESAKSGPVAFERTTRAELRADPENEPALVVDRFSPKSGWTVVSVDGRKPTARELEAHAKGNSNAPGFHNVHKLLNATPKRRTESGGKAVYLWNGLPKGTIVTPGGDISANLSVEATIDESGAKPVLNEVRIFAAKPFRVKIVASINKFNVISLYRPAANGTPFLVAQTSETDVTAPMGLGGKRLSVASFKPL